LRARHGPAALAAQERLAAERALPLLAALGQRDAALTLPFETRADAVLPLALVALEVRAPELASLWREAWAGFLAQHARPAQELAALEDAARAASGVRALVLLRRVAEAHLGEGRPERAHQLLSRVARTLPTPSPLPNPSELRSVLQHQLTRGPPAPEGGRARTPPALDRWDTLAPDAALTAVELVRAEALSHLVKTEDALRTWEEASRRLERMSGPVAHVLWLRWATASSWFLSEVCGRPGEVSARCARVRAKVPADAIAASEAAFDFLRAEEIAASSSGDFARAQALVEEEIALTHRTGNLRDRCLAWNARAILHFGQGALDDALAAFSTSLQLAAQTDWLRRQAIATHNLALVHCERLELDRASALVDSYAALSPTLGNHAALAEAPLVRAAVELARLAPEAAKKHLDLARKHAEDNGWKMLEAWSRSLAGRLQLITHALTKDRLALPRAKNELLAALALLEEHAGAWTEEVDPGETYALLAAAQLLSGQLEAAHETLQRGQRAVPPQNVVSHRALLVGRAFVGQTPLDGALRWFEENANQRLPKLWRALAAVRA
jgi:tetratricopeptide (TPR) repeat protein